MNIQFCIKHQKLVDVENLKGSGIGHLCALFSPDWGWCEGPFTSCPPPDNFDNDWDIDLTEPSFEEMAAMNLQAEMLLQELEG